MKVNIGSRGVVVTVSVITGVVAGQLLSELLALGPNFMGSTITTIASLAISLTGLFVFHKFLPAQSQTLAKEMQAIADGKKSIDTKLIANGDATMKAVANSYNLIVQQLLKSIGELTKQSNELAFTASKMSEATERTESNTFKQQNETDQVATAMNEMTSTVEEVARNASDASAAAQAANKSAQTGVGVAHSTKQEIQTLVHDIERASNVIHNLESESANIGVVLDVIKGIAEQTNLLALNAAIEAARAGEQGRGFAVVADEVRTLASRTQTSTQEIEEMISRLQSGVNDSVAVMQVALEKGRNGEEQVDSTLSALNEIMTSVEKINDMNAQIATAAEEQSQVAGEINRNIVSIGNLSVETTDYARQSRETSVQVAGISMKIGELMKKFGAASNKSLDLSSAKAAHLNWKTRLRSFLDGEEALSVEQAVSHRHCDFGKWYYSDGLEHFGHLHGIKQVEKPHEELHKLIKNIIELKSEGKIRDAEKAFEKVATLSENIVGCLDDAEREAQG